MMDDPLSEVSDSIPAVVGADTEIDEPSTDAETEIVVQRLDDDRKYSATVGDWEIANLKYTVSNRRVVVLSTAVDPRFRGRGIAGDLIADALDDIRAQGMKVTVRCPVVARFLASNPQYADLLEEA